MFALAPKYNKENDKTKEAKYEHISAFRKYAELAQASYCLQLQVGMGKIPNDTKFINALIDTNYEQHFTRDRAIQFVSIYEVIAHYTPKQTEGFFGSIHSFFNDDGFSATLFGEKRKQKNTESKAIQYTSEYDYINYILAIRGTEPNNKGDIGADTKLALGNLPKKQHLDILLFYNQCNRKYSFYVERESKEYIESRKVA